MQKFWSDGSLTILTKWIDSIEDWSCLPEKLRPLLDEVNETKSVVVKTNLGVKDTQNNGYKIVRWSKGPRKIHEHKK